MELCCAATAIGTDLETNMTTTPGQILKTLVQTRRGVLMPGAANALTARIIEELGYEAVYVTGAGVSNTWLGMPDLSFVGLGEIAAHTAAIRGAVSLPIVVDADTGFGNAVNMYHAIRTLERAGANAIQIEDQVMPKKCGHFAGKAVVPKEEMVDKIKAALDARQSEDCLIIARTDSRAVEGFEAAADRCRAYREAGADIIFLEAPESLDELKTIPKTVDAPHLVNIVVGGKTPMVSTEELGAMGFSLVLYANVALQAAVQGMTAALKALKDGKDVSEASGLVASFAERQSLVKKPFFDELEKRYSR
jgi:2-methylisocitrate lyase-like PEP mutase family enzyme